MVARVRRQEPADRAGASEVLAAAFGRSSEGALADRLCARGDTFALVAAGERELLGCVVFVPVEIVGACLERQPMAVGLIGVRPTWQSQGIGGELLQRGVEECRSRRAGLIVVIGPAGFYGRFGFVPAAPLGIRCRWKVPEPLFRVLELVPGEVSRANGVVRYLREFST